jgi:hypothetical protein
MKTRGRRTALNPFSPAKFLDALAGGPYPRAPHNCSRFEGAPRSPGFG